MSVTTEVSRHAVACLLDGAIGDALGAAVEFDSAQEIRARYGPAGIRMPDVAYGRPGAITDDTQMTLVLADSLAGAGDEPLDRVAAAGYLRWYRSQEPGAVGAVGPDGGDPEWSAAVVRQGRRGPGATCLASLAEQTWPPTPVDNDRKGCGTVMRVAPLGLYLGTRAPEITDGVSRRIYAAGVADAALTHGHPTAHHASGLLAVLFARAVHGTPMAEAVDRTLADLGTDDLTPLCRRALAWAGDAPDADRLTALGAGWVAEEDLAIGLYVALLVVRGALPAADGLRLAVNHGGDSDSTGSLAGQLIGAWTAAVPRELIAPGTELAELEPLITRVATRLVAGADPNERAR